MAQDFRRKQAEFAAHIRDPEHHPAPSDVEPQRMAMYRELFFNNINSMLSSNFPVLRRVLDDGQWLALIEDFYRRHRCQTPHFSEIAEEFLDYLQNERDTTGDYPFLLELAHYEWVEMALAIAQAEPAFGDSNFADNILQQPIALSPLAWPLVYRYPVEKIGPTCLPQTAPEQPTYLIVYRAADDDVHFTQTTPLTYCLLQRVEHLPGLTGEQVLEALTLEVAEQLDAQSVRDFGLQTLQELARKGILIPATDV